MIRVVSPSGRRTPNRHPGAYFSGFIPFSLSSQSFTLWTWFLCQIRSSCGVGGGSMVGKSIESYEFGGDGSLIIRTHCVIPAHDDEALGDLYKVYLPGEPQGSR